MQLSDLGSIGEFVSSIAVLTTLILLLVEVKRNNVIQRRQNAKQSARDNGSALQAVLAVDVSEIFLRGNTEGLTVLTAHERYRYDVTYYIWLQTIEQAYADFRVGLYPDDSIAPWANSVQGFLSTTGGSAWWEERKFWFSQEFRLDVDRLLASENPEAALSGHAKNND